MIKKSPKITVVMPLFNREKYVYETIISIIKQNYKNFELIIIDDGSTDNSKSIVTPFLKDKRLKYLYQKNIGEAETVNKGWTLARGEYFTQVNSDDPIKSNLFKEMVKTLDKNTDAVVAYPDFEIIDEIGNVISETRSPDWKFLEALSSFSCYAASPGTFIRKSSFQDLKILKDKRFKHTNDIYMYWKMALKGPFIHIPKILATWRSHSSAISTNRYEAIPEIEVWLDEYFKQESLPKDIKNIEQKVRRSVINYYITLLNNSPIKNKKDMILKYKNKLNESKYTFKNLQIGDNDLIGGQFNGHNLHLYLREKNIDSKHLVWNKESNDENTYIIAQDKPNRHQINSTIQEIHKQYSLNGVLNPLTYDILYNESFLETDVVHMHLIHNLNFDLQLLPLFTRLKPTVWTIHDPWVLSGHCIQSFNCTQWKTSCGDCPFLGIPYPMELDNTALNFELKKMAIQNSKLDIIVASEYMMDLLKTSTMFKNARLHLVPFGINQNIFKPKDKITLRKKLSIPEDAVVITFRSDYNDKKGSDYIEYFVENIKTKKNIFLIAIGGGSKWKPKEINYKYLEYGWLKDEKEIAEIYSISDIFLMPSKVESFGLMAVEAMSCGVLPIVLEGTALPTVINSPECGIAVEKNMEEFTKIVQYYIEHDIERNERMLKCLKYAVKEYNKEIYINRIIEVYKIAMANHTLDFQAKKVLFQLKKYMITRNNLNSQIPTTNLPSNTFLHKIKKKVKDIVKKVFNYWPPYRKIQNLEELIQANINNTNTLTTRFDNFSLSSNEKLINLEAEFNNMKNGRLLNKNELSNKSPI